ncbi:MAG: L,D-transpeptidase family protein [Gemmatimonadaceae bacterium]
MRPLGILGAGLALALTTACGREESAGGDVSRSWNPAGLTKVKDVPIASIRSELERALEARPQHATADQWEHAKQLYALHKNSPLWMNGDGVIDSRARALVDALINAASDAIQLDQYPLLELAVALDSMRRVEQPGAAQIARADLLLTTAYVGLGEDYLTGQIDPKSVAQSWHIDPEEKRVDSALVRTLREADLAEAIGRMRPQDSDYDMLRRQLDDYRKIVAAGGWPRVPEGKSLKRGDVESPARLQALRARLRAEGLHTDSSATYDQSLATAVAQFQQRHAIGVDSTLGSETLASLNITADFRLAQIAANLERYRWLPRSLGDRYILVNVPSFQLQAFDHGNKTLEMKVIVGSEFEDRATPAFSDRMEFVVFRPYWNVTDDIAAKELFPKFAAQGMPSDYETYTESGKLRLRQKPGDGNSLGLVKFMFPNDFNIYLHDTPQRQLFNTDVRAYSHGCIRVEKPNALAQWVLGWNASRVEQAMHGTDNRHVNLPEKIPVFIAYMTAYVRDGQLWFGNDLYKRDDQLARAMYGGALPSTKVVHAISALRRLTD